RDGWSTRLQPCMAARPQCFVRLPVCISYCDAFNSGPQNGAYTNGVTLSLPLCRIERNTTKIRGINETAVTNCPVTPNNKAAYRHRYFHLFGINEMPERLALALCRIPMPTDKRRIWHKCKQCSHR